MDIKAFITARIKQQGTMCDNLSTYSKVFSSVSVNLNFMLEDVILVNSVNIFDILFHIPQ